MNKPHVHAEVIKAWADGAEIEYFSQAFNEWRSIKYPDWHQRTQYRVKPKPNKWQHLADAKAKDPSLVIEYRHTESLSPHYRQWRVCTTPIWGQEEGEEYRIKSPEEPKVTKKKVPMWQWIYKNTNAVREARHCLTNGFYPDAVNAQRKLLTSDIVIGKAEWTRIEVEVEND